MDLEELQSVWTEMSDQLEKQKKLTHEIIMNMTQERYTNKFQKITHYESIGALICFAAAIAILLNFSNLDTWYLILCGIIALSFLLVLPVMVLRSLQRIKNINITNSSFKETLVSYSKAKRQLLFTQRLGIYLSVIFMFVSLPLASKIMKNKDLFLEPGVLYWYLPVMALFLFFFARWGYRCYLGITNSAEDLIKELDQQV